MDTFECIMKRKTVRSFNDKPVSMEQVNSVLEAAANAPSAGNQQGRSFIVIDKPEILRKLAHTLPFGKFIMHSKYTIVTVMDSSGRYPGFAPQDCAASMQNMLLTAYSLGLAAVWVGIYPKDDAVEDTRDLLGIPAHLTPFAALVLANADELPENVVRLTPEMVHYNGW